jgi:hypothetical protein
VSDWPSVAVPLIVGRASLLGGAGGGSSVSLTIAVADELDEADPELLVALTTTRMVWPTSPAPS